MNTIQTAVLSASPSPKAAAPTVRGISPSLAVALWLGGSVAAFMGAMGVLSAVNWPQYLEFSAAKALPHLAGHDAALQQGYSLYLLSVLLLVPIVAVAQETLSRRWAAASAFFGGAAVIFKCLGIGRWLLVMPYLIHAHAADSAGSALRQSLEIQYEVMNRYAGGVGEQFGVALFTAVWLAILALGTTRHISRWRFAAMGAGAVTVILWAVEIAQFMSGGEIGAIRTIASILNWVFLALFAASLRTGTR